MCVFVRALLFELFDLASKHLISIINAPWVVLLERLVEVFVSVINVRMRIIVWMRSICF